MSKINKKHVDRINSICYDGIWQRNNSKICERKEYFELFKRLQ